MNEQENDQDTHLAWLDLMLGEIDARRRERREAEEERARRVAQETQEK